MSRKIVAVVRKRIRLRRRRLRARSNQPKGSKLPYSMSEALPVDFHQPPQSVRHGCSPRQRRSTRKHSAYPSPTTDWNPHCNWPEYGDRSNRTCSRHPASRSRRRARPLRGGRQNSRGNPNKHPLVSGVSPIPGRNRTGPPGASGRPWQQMMVRTCNHNRPPDPPMYVM